jgi:hypothetical protein
MSATISSPIKVHPASLPPASLPPSILHPSLLSHFQPPTITTTTFVLQTGIHTISLAFVSALIIANTSKAIASPMSMLHCLLLELEVEVFCDQPRVVIMLLPAAKGEVLP